MCHQFAQRAVQQPILSNLDRSKGAPNDSLVGKRSVHNSGWNKDSVERVCGTGAMLKRILQVCHPLHCRNGFLEIVSDWRLAKKPRPSGAQTFEAGTHRRTPFPGSLRPTAKRTYAKNAGTRTRASARCAIISLAITASHQALWSGPRRC